MITNEIIQIVNEAHDFQFSELGQELKQSGHPPQYWGKWVKINSHRRAGFTTAAIALQQSYTSSLLVTHNHAIKQHIYHLANELGLYHDWMKDQVKTYEEVMNPNFFAGLGINARHQLIIIDPASMVEQRLQSRIHEFRDHLFQWCDVVVELQ